MAYIYKITNKLNQNVYIGKTERDIETRWKEHCSHVNVYPHIPLYRAIKKYGKENFIIEIIEECDAANIDNQEMYWINYYNTTNNNCKVIFNFFGHKIKKTSKSTKRFEIFFRFMYF